MFIMRDFANKHSGNFFLRGTDYKPVNKKIESSASHLSSVRNEVLRTGEHYSGGSLKELSLMDKELLILGSLLEGIKDILGSAMESHSLGQSYGSQVTHHHHHHRNVNRRSERSEEAHHSTASSSPIIPASNYSSDSMSEPSVIDKPSIKIPDTAHTEHISESSSGSEKSKDKTDILPGSGNFKSSGEINLNFMESYAQEVKEFMNLLNNIKKILGYKSEFSDGIKGYSSSGTSGITETGQKAGEQPVIVKNDLPVSEKVTPLVPSLPTTETSSGDDTMLGITDKFIQEYKEKSPEITESAITPTEEKIQKEIKPEVMPSAEKIQEEIKPVITPSAEKVQEEIKPVITPSAEKIQEEIKPVITLSAEKVQEEIKPEVTEPEGKIQGEIKPEVTPTEEKIQEEIKPVIPAVSGKVSEDIQSVIPAVSGKVPEDIQSVIPPSAEKLQEKKTEVSSDAYKDRGQDLTQVSEETVIGDNKKSEETSSLPFAMGTIGDGEPEKEIDMDSMLDELKKLLNEDARKTESDKNKEDKKTQDSSTPVKTDNSSQIAYEERMKQTYKELIDGLRKANEVNQTITGITKDPEVQKKIEMNNKKIKEYEQNINECEQNIKDFQNAGTAQPVSENKEPGTEDKKTEEKPKDWKDLIDPKKLDDPSTRDKVIEKLRDSGLNNDDVNDVMSKLREFGREITKGSGSETMKSSLSELLSTCREAGLMESDGDLGKVKDLLENLTPSDKTATDTIVTGEVRLDTGQSDPTGGKARNLGNGITEFDWDNQHKGKGTVTDTGQGTDRGIILNDGGTALGDTPDTLTTIHNKLLEPMEPIYDNSKPADTSKAADTSKGADTTLKGGVRIDDGGTALGDTPDTLTTIHNKLLEPMEPIYDTSKPADTTLKGGVTIQDGGTAMGDSPDPLTTIHGTIQEPPPKSVDPDDLPYKDVTIIDEGVTSKIIVPSGGESGETGTSVDNSIPKFLTDIAGLGMVPSSVEDLSKAAQEWVKNPKVISAIEAAQKGVVLKEGGGILSKIVPGVGSAVNLASGIKLLQEAQEAQKAGDSAGAALKFTHGCCDLIGVIPGPGGAAISLGSDVILGILEAIHDSQNEAAK